MSPPLILAAILTIAVALAWARLALWQLRAAPEARSPAWRVALLAVAQPLCALLLYLTLVPPPVRTAAGTLVVATRGASRLPVSAGTVVALPEAPTGGAERVPDLGTALRRYPDTQRLVVLGEGLTPRDLEAARGLAVSFPAPAEPRGLVRLDPPARVAPGAAFEVGGRVAGRAGGSVELLDPAGRVVDRRALDGDGGFALRGTARAAGASLFALLVRDAGRRVIERAAVPVVAADEPAPRVLLLAGAPGPEPKFLRRWAADTGVTLHSRLAAGGGLELGDAPLAINRSTLARFDLAILDERSWAALGASERAAVTGAVRDGLGLVLRVTGTLPEPVRREWRALGFGVTGGAEAARVRLAGPSGELTRRVVRIDAADDVPLLRDAAGQALASWRALGRGRVALWPVTDSYVLALAGAPNAHARLWSEALAVLARPRAAAPPTIEPLPRVQQRLTICGLGPEARIVAPGGGVIRLVVEPPARCAAFWPAQPGWHQLRDASRSWPFHVQAADALPGLRAADARAATMRLVAGQGVERPSGATRVHRGSSWPWFLAWLAASAALWWFERRPATRPVAA